MQQQSSSRSLSVAYGFVGAGALTAAIVEGLSANGAEPPSVFLSPRGRGAELASRFPNVRVCASNQEVLENATSVVVAVRPQVGREVLAELSFRPEHVVLSVLAGVRLARLRDWAAPAEHVVRLIPLPSAASGRSLTAMYPDNTVARDLFGRVGDVLVPSDESTLDAFSAASATFAAHLDYLATIANWLTDHGVDHDAATAYVRLTFGELGQSFSQRTASLATLTDEHMTPCGINEQFMTDLRHDGMPDMVRRALDRILTRLRE